MNKFIYNCNISQTHNSKRAKRVQNSIYPLPNQNSFHKKVLIHTNHISGTNISLLSFDYKKPEKVKQEEKYKCNTRCPFCCSNSTNIPGFKREIPSNKFFCRHHNRKCRRILVEKIPTEIREFTVCPTVGVDSLSCNVSNPGRKVSCPKETLNTQKKLL